MSPDCCVKDVPGPYLPSSNWLTHRHQLPWLHQLSDAMCRPGGGGPKHEEDGGPQSRVHSAVASILPTGPRLSPRHFRLRSPRTQLHPRGRSRSTFIQIADLARIRLCFGCSQWVAIGRGFSPGLRASAFLSFQTEIATRPTGADERKLWYKSTHARRRTQLRSDTHVCSRTPRALRAYRDGCFGRLLLRLEAVKPFPAALKLDHYLSAPRLDEPLPVLLIAIRLRTECDTLPTEGGDILAPLMTLAPGTQLGPYEIVSQLGSGGMGVVYEARDPRLRRTVAIKLLPPDLTKDDTAKQRFLQEAQVASALDHPNICTIHEINETDDGQLYLVMAHYEGETLKKRIERGPLELDDAVDIATQVGQGLAEAHKAGIVHRDIKPANLLVTNSGVVKILDFGLAKLAGTEGVTQTGTTVGTVAYMSPEQARGQEVDHRTDIWSLGVVLYEMLAGQPPFQGENLLAISNAILQRPPKSLSGQRTDVPPEVEEGVTRMMTKVRENRYQTAADLVSKLERIKREVTEATGASASQPDVPSIAVLPFADMSPEKDQDYFCEGMAEEIINTLTHVEGLKVIARTSAFAFKGQNVDIRKIAETLGVTSVLEGSVRRAGNRIRVTVQLIDAVDGSHRWSERYDRELEDVFAIQDEIAQAIASALRTTLSAGARPVHRYTPTLPAYEALLRARHDLQKWTPESLAKGREQLEQAIALDPGFGQAHTELGWCLFGLVSENCMPPREAAALMRTHARQALAIDSSLREAHAVLGTVAVLDYDWDDAGSQFRLALARDPVSPVVRWFYSYFYLAPLGRMREAEAEIERAIADDPLNLLFRVILAFFYVGTNRSTEAEVVLRQVLELDANYWLAHNVLGALHFNRGLFDEAVSSCQRAHTQLPDHPGLIGLLAGALDRAGDEVAAEALVQKLGDGTAFGAPIGLVFYYFARAEFDHAADWFEKGIAQRDTRMPFIVPHFFGDRFTSSPHWDRLAKLMHLPDGR